MKIHNHNCKDGTRYEWESRVENPKACPRCKARLDAPKPAGGETVLIQKPKAKAK